MAAFMSSAGVSLSVVIPTRARAAKLRNLLSDLARTAPTGADLEVIIVVDGPDDGPLAAAKTLPTTLPCIVLVQPAGGPAAARNLALERARGDWVLFLNDDARLTEATLAGHFARIAADPRACRAYLGRFDFEPAVIDSAWRRLLAETSMLFFYNRMRPDESYGYRHFWTCNLSVRTDLVREVGGFCAALNARCEGVAVHEDIELGWRLQRRFGLEVAFADEIGARHDHALSPHDYFRREYRAGAGAAVAAQVNRAFHDEVWPWVSDAGAQADALRSILGGQLSEALREMQSLTQRPASDLSRHEMRSAYLAHVPLKRLCFLLGYAGREFDEVWPDPTTG